MGEKVIHQLCSDGGGDGEREVFDEEWVVIELKRVRVEHLTQLQELLSKGLNLVLDPINTLVDLLDLEGQVVVDA